MNDIAPRTAKKRTAGGRVCENCAISKALFGVIMSVQLPIILHLSRLLRVLILCNFKPVKNVQIYIRKRLPGMA